MASGSSRCESARGVVSQHLFRLAPLICVAFLTHSQISRERVQSVAYSELGSQGLYPPPVWHLLLRRRDGSHNDSWSSSRLRVSKAVRELSPVEEIRE